jgi:hypothetical protein
MDGAMMRQHPALFKINLKCVRGRGAFKPQGMPASNRPANFLT